MSARRRALPSWMAKKEDEAKEKEPLKSSRKRKAARAAFYCMNERELVEAAAACLTDGACEGVVLWTHQQVERKAEDAVKKREKPAASQTTTKPVTAEESSDCGEDLESTYVSETDLDITEVETVPYTKSPQHPGCEGQRSEPAEDHDKWKEQSEMPADAAKEDDALRLVREIFFT